MRRIVTHQEFQPDYNAGYDASKETVMEHNKEHATQLASASNTPAPLCKMEDYYYWQGWIDALYDA
ncbi:MAG: hypothetical protein IAF02_15725 [Anaerolineae bacterium]|nr:hypothetical protein [Anaerolineae bacterium]